MGLTQTVTCPRGAPAWDSLREHLVKRGLTPQLRMIDGELSFPDETPGPEWRELRLALPQGMVTLRRAGDKLAFVVWGNADAALVAAWNALVQATAEFSGGEVFSD